METRIKLRTSYFDIMINYQLSQKLKLLGNFELNHLIIIQIVYNNMKDGFTHLHQPKLLFQLSMTQEITYSTSYYSTFKKSQIWVILSFNQDLCT